MRGQFYSLIAIIIAIPIVVFMSYFVYSQGSESGVYENIVADQIHQIMRSVETDFGKAMVTSGKRALIAGDDYVVMSGKAMDDSVEGMKELMVNGTIDGNESLLMFNNTLGNWTRKILNVPTNFIVNITFDNLDISEYDSFRIKASADLNVSVADDMGIGKIDKRGIYYEKFIPVEDAEDPIFTLKTNGVITRSVKISPYNYRAKKLVKGGTNSSGNCTDDITFDKSDCTSKILVTENMSGVNPSCFSGFVLEDPYNFSGVSDCYVTGNSSTVELISQAMSENGYWKVYIDDDTRSVWHLPIRDEIDNKYYFSGQGPDFLKRLEGNLNQSANGMETFVNLPELQSYELPIEENVISVAYIYFGGQNYIGYQVRGLQSWFRLDKTFTDRYGLTELCDGC